MQDTPFDGYLKNILVEVSEINSGEVASYIPELSKVDPNLFGISVVTVDGHVYQVGDTQHPFTIQSISKPFVYGLALEDNGVAKVLNKVDVEPSGEAFNSISLEANTGRPKNAMINAGAIATTGLVYGEDSSKKIDRILRHLITYTGHKLSIDNSVYRSESETGHRNKAISYLLRNSEIIEQDPDPILDVYFKQCSILVTCRDLALAAPFYSAAWRVPTPMVHSAACPIPASFSGPPALLPDCAGAACFRLTTRPCQPWF